MYSSLNRLRSVAVILFSMFMIFGTSVGYGVIIRHDRADSRYIVNEEDYPQVFFLHTRYDNKLCVATMLSPTWAITAAHCADQTPMLETLGRSQYYPVTIAGSDYKIEELIIHPDYVAFDHANSVDLALFRIDKPVSHIKPARLNRESNETVQVVSMLGWGSSGIGTLGTSKNDGKFRYAENRVEEADKWLTIRFDDPRINRDKVLALEGVPGLGDSGGPAFRVIDGQLVIFGIALGELTDDTRENQKQGLYGAIEVYERVSSHLAWIDAIVPD